MDFENVADAPVDVIDLLAHLRLGTFPRVFAATCALSLNALIAFV